MMTWAPRPHGARTRGKKRTWRRNPFISPKMFTTQSQGNPTHDAPIGSRTPVDKYRRRPSRREVDSLSHLFSDSSPNGAQVIAALLHGACTLHTGSAAPSVACVAGTFETGKPDVQAETATFLKATEPHSLWEGSTPLCLAEHNNGKVRRLRFFFCTGRGAMCAERHKSPSRIRMGSVRNEPDQHGQRNQTKTQKPPKQKQEPTNTEPNRSGSCPY